MDPNSRTEQNRRQPDPANETVSDLDIVLQVCRFKPHNVLEAAHRGHIRPLQARTPIGDKRVQPNVEAKQGKTRRAGVGAAVEAMPSRGGAVCIADHCPANRSVSG